MRLHLVLVAALAILVASCFDSVSARLTQRELKAVEARELFFTPPAWWNDNVNSWWNHIKGWSKAQWQEISASELAKWSKEQWDKVDPEHLKYLKPEQWDAIPVDKIKDWASDHIKSIPVDRIKKWGKEHFDKLSKEQLGELTAEQWKNKGNKYNSRPLRDFIFPDKTQF